ncbi:MAG: RNA polymerase sigma factor [Thermomicrobiales bacterium]
MERRDQACEDAELAHRAVHDREAFGALYDRYAVAVYRYCYRRTGTREQAEDVTSAIFTRALERLPSFRGGSFPAWLFAIAHSVANNAARRPSAVSLARSESEPDVDPSPEERAVHADERRALRVALEALPADQRRIVELRLAGLTGGEIAAALGKSVAAVKMSQLRAFRQLRQALATPGAESADEIQAQLRN